MRASGGGPGRKAMIGRDHPRLGVGRQAQLPGVDRNRLAGRLPKARLEDVALMAGIDRIHSDWPVHGSRKLRAGLLRRKGRRVGRGRMRRLMGLTGIGAVAPRLWTSPAPEYRPLDTTQNNR